MADSTAAVDPNPPPSVGQPEDSPASECVLSLLRTEGLVSSGLQRELAEHGLTLAGFNVMTILRGSCGSLCPHQIGERRLITRGAVTGILDSLERQGLVRRLPHPEDRRMLNIELTAEGHRRLDRILPSHRASERELLSCLDDSEKETLTQLLTKIQSHLTRSAE